MDEQIYGIDLWFSSYPQWEPIRIDFDEVLQQYLVPELKLFAKDRKCVHGVLIQVGWMVQNKNDVWMGLPMNVTEHFIDLGEA